MGVTKNKRKVIKQPENITLCKVECVLMPNGEIIIKGKTIGMFKDLQPYLEYAQEEEDVKTNLVTDTDRKEIAINLLDKRQLEKFEQKVNQLEKKIR